MHANRITLAHVLYFTCGNCQQSSIHEILARQILFSLALGPETALGVGHGWNPPARPPYARAGIQPHKQ